MGRAVGKGETGGALALTIDYNLFRRRACPGVICAVPETAPVPAFIDGAWEFCGRVLETGRLPTGFRPDVASGAVRLTGFYVFHDGLVAGAASAPDEAERAAPAPDARRSAATL